MPPPPLLSLAAPPLSRAARHSLADRRVALLLERLAKLQQPRLHARFRWCSAISSFMAARAPGSTGEAVALTLAGAAGNSIGKFLQKKGTLILPPLSFKFKVIWGYALNRLWISRFLLDMCGAALMLTALSQAPVSVVQPIAGRGLAILCVFSHFYFKEVMNGLDWIAITLAGLGTIGVGVGGEEQKVETIPLLNILGWCSPLPSCL